MTAKTCRTCPAFVGASDAASVYVKSPGADTCARHGHVLSKPMALPEQNERIAQLFAQGCGEHGEPRPSSIPFTTFRVGTGDPTTFGAAPAPEDQPSLCSGCVNFIPPETVADELGWGLGMCAAKGTLLFSNRYAAEAGSCGVGVAGAPRDTADGVILAPEYEGVSVTVARRRPAEYHLNDELARHAVDPREYATDKPVGDAELAAGIRAWRQINDPEGIHDPVFLPIFDGERVCGSDPRTTYGAHRPDLYLDHQGLLYDAAVELLELDETPVCIGGAGTGKTEFGCWLAHLMDLPFWRLSVQKGTEDWHFAGETKLVTDDEGNQVTEFVPGRFTAKYNVPGVIMVDEPNLKADIYEFLRPAFDSAKQLVIDAAQGLVVDRHNFCFVMASQNPSDDPIYVGTEPMSAADMDRVTPIRFGLPDDSTERAIIRKHCADIDYFIDDDTLDKIMQIAVEIRQLIRDGELMISWGIRPQVKVARKTKYYSLEKAYRRAVVDGLDEDSVNGVMAPIRSVAS